MAVFASALELTRRFGFDIPTQVIRDEQIQQAVSVNVEPRPYTAEPTIVRPLLRAGQRALMIMGIDANGLTPYRGRRDARQDTRTWA